MKTLSLLLLAWAAVGSLFAAPFTTASKIPQAMVDGKISGSFSIEPDKVLVDISQGKITRQEVGMQFSPQRRVVGIRAVLAKWTSNFSGYTIVAKSEMLPIDQTISVGQSVSIDNKKLEIPTENIPSNDIKHTWLEFEVICAIPTQAYEGKTGSTYIICDVFLGGGATNLRMRPPR